MFTPTDHKNKSVRCLDLIHSLMSCGCEKFMFWCQVCLLVFAKNFLFAPIITPMSDISYKPNSFTRMFIWTARWVSICIHACTHACMGIRFVWVEMKTCVDYLISHVSWSFCFVSDSVFFVSICAVPVALRFTYLVRVRFPCSPEH